MRIKSLVISGFRAFTQTTTFDLDADVVILSGPNGTGKTSVFDAILWGLTGRIDRLQSSGEEVIASRFSSSGVGYIAMDLESAQGELMSVTRSIAEGETRLVVESEGSRLEGLQAEAALQRRWGTGGDHQDTSAFSAALTRSVYLQQDLVREFIESDTDQERFKVLAGLVGAGRLSVLEQQLDAERRAWSRNLNEAIRDREKAQELAARLEARLSSLVADSDSEKLLRADWDQWWSRARAAGLPEGQPEVVSGQAPSRLTEALREIVVQRTLLGRRIAGIQSLIDELTAWSSQQPNVVAIEELRDRGRSLRDEVHQLKDQVNALRESAALLRREQVLQAETAEQLKAMAQLALAHIEKECPVCGQTHDVSATRLRLEAMIGAESSAARATEVEESLRHLLPRLGERESALAEIDARVGEVDQYQATIRRLTQELPSRFKDLGLELPGGTLEDSIKALQRAVVELEKRYKEKERLHEEGERLALKLLRSSEVSQRSDISRNLRDAQRQVDTMSRDIQLRERVRHFATTFHEALRDAGMEAVHTQIKRIEPIFERIYARIDPHPAFTDVRLLADLYRRKGTINTLVSDPRSELFNQTPRAVFSSSQLNALAVSLFLGMNLGVPRLPLKIALLDDPLQSLDDVNLLGLCDVLRRTKAFRQLIVSTHDGRLTSLLRRKLRPLQGGRTLIYQFDGWTPDGPHIRCLEVPRDTGESRVVEAA